jgi:hypothetical protein
MIRVFGKGDRLIVTDLDGYGFEFLTEEYNERWMGFKRDAI